ncbi:ABC transporter permease [Actinomadura rupiterrae]|uniref:ABC transporter permease n=1 Tax=Actinomadura rupiterrae TaxID=559627 RepID=UPI0020A50075|nr:ABC transporter permease [Actinomadura rupiterrae]MCP2342757.1 NitT/TauT family transport system permease protein [Actinomadura rupiterrae]
MPHHQPELPDQNDPGVPPHHVAEQKRSGVPLRETADRDRPRVERGEMVGPGRSRALRRAGGARGRLRVGSWLPPLVVLLLAVGGWYGVSDWVLSPERRFLLPPPDAVVRVGFLDRDNRAELFAALGRTAEVAGLGLLIATAVGVGLAVLMSQARWVERSLYPYAVVLQTVPVLALVPLLGFWFGFGMASRVLVCVLVAVFPVIANTLFGLRSTDGTLEDVFRLARAGRLRRLLKLRLPAALPAMVTGLRISAGLSVVGAVVGDYFYQQGSPGLGILINIYRARLESERMFAAVLLASLLGLAVFWAFGLLARWTARLHGTDGNDR